MRVFDLKNPERVVRLENAKLDSQWFIADTMPLRTIFEGVVPLLDIGIDDLAPMEQAMQILGLKSRLLSKQARGAPRTRGVVALNEHLTDTFRSKLDFIIRLIPASKERRKKRREVITRLRNLEVYTADEVIQKWCVYYKGKWVHGPPGNGQVALVPDKDILKIYIAAKSGFELGETPIELVDEFFNFCGMSSEMRKHSEMCLHVALSENNSARIEKVFADKGIPSLESLKFADDPRR